MLLRKVTLNVLLGRASIIFIEHLSDDLCLRLFCAEKVSIKARGRLERARRSVLLPGGLLTNGSSLIVG